MVGVHVPATTWEGLAEWEGAALDRGRPSAFVAPFAGPTTLSIGVGVAEDARYVRAARALGRPVVRRSTGGTAVLHQPGDLLWSLVLPRTDPRVGRDFVRAYDRLGEPVVRWLARSGVPGRWAEPPAISDEYCPLGARGRVLRCGDRVLGAAAQHATGRALLHHGFVARTLDRPLVDRLFPPPPGGLATHLVALEELPGETTETDRGSGLAEAWAEFVGRT